MEKRSIVISKDLDEVKTAVLVFKQRGDGDAAKHLLKVIDHYKPDTVEELIEAAKPLARRTVQRYLTTLRTDGFVTGVRLTTKGSSKVAGLISGAE